MRRLLLCFIALLSQNVFASASYWSELDAHHEFDVTHPSGDRHQYSGRRMQLDMLAFKERVTSYSDGASLGSLISLPTPDGQYLTFRTELDPVLSPALAARYPDIQTWKITSVGNSNVYGRIDIGPRGFHGSYYLDGDLITIDPEYHLGQHQTLLYTVFSKRVNNTQSDSALSCSTQEVEEEKSESVLELSRKSPLVGLRTYRLALAVTGEYTQLFGGTKALALAAITTTVNRINQIFERDFNLRLELVDDNDKLLFLEPSFDPYISHDAADMVTENIIAISALIGSENYDIGHVLGTGRIGGLAFIGSACGQYKAGGVTGSNSPHGESFNVDYVAHEIGHQLGALHTFNGTQRNCTSYSRMPSSAIEPGSGSTIMGYAGICGDDDLQPNTDPYFHSISIAQVMKFTREDKGAGCGAVVPSVNNDPQVDAGRDYVIPEQTPFELTGSAFDIDEQNLTYSWEQIDVGTASDVYSDLGDNPLFRVWKPNSHPTRYIPRLKDLLLNKLAVGELLPLTAREMNFSLVVRDNTGGIATDEMKVSVAATGEPFAITSNNIAEKLISGETFDLNWNVASTNLPPINCQFVDIGFIMDTGKHTLVLRNTPNDGRETVLIPSWFKPVHQENIKLSCSDNVFFAVSKTKHSIASGLPTLSIDKPRIALSELGEQTLIYPLWLSAKAKENIVIDYQVTSTVTKEANFTGMVSIAVGQKSVNVEVPVIETTLEEAEKVMRLVIQQSDTPQFKLEEIATSSASGGGGFGTLMAMLLLLLGYFRQITRSHSDASSRQYAASDFFSKARTCEPRIGALLL
jgi:hypothetical protein